MKFVADECCDVPFVSGLRADGHDVVFIREVAPGADDRTVLQLAVNEERILVTEDKDFGELVVRFDLPAYGIVLVRMNPADSDGKLQRVRSAIESHGERFAGSFVVIDEFKIRFRPLKSRK